MRVRLLDPAGFRTDGRPFWAFSAGDGEGGDGGDGSGGDSGSGGDGSGDGGDDDDLKVGEDGLTGRGRRALEKERGTLKNVRSELRGLKSVLAPLGIKTPEELVARLTGNQGSDGGQNGSSGQQNGSNQQVDVEKIRREIAAEIQAGATRDVVLAKIEARAAKSFADPSDAVVYLAGQTDDLLDDNGRPDDGAIEAALTELLTKKPHLKAVSEERPPDFEGGARQTAGAPKDMDAFLRGVAQAKRGAR